MMIEPRFDHVGINVADLDASIAFLKAMFDFDVIQKWDSPRQAFVGKGSVVLGVMEKKDYDFTPQTMAHIAFPCRKEEFPSIVAQVRRMGAPIVSGPKPQRDGETILFRDPSGNIFEVCYPSLKA
jgi:catechol 2,3-dioxygenase-like lactoylglutathione lyase family enzyme